MNGNFSKILYTYEEIIKAIKKLSFDLNGYYRSLEGEEIVVIALLDGGLVFAGNLLLELDFNIIFKTAKGPIYVVGKNGRREVTIYENYIPSDVKGRHVLVLDGLQNTGKTIERIVKNLISYGAVKVKTCVLFKKENKDKNIVPPDWFGLLIPNEWVAGFGTDSRDKYRNIKHLGIVKIDRR